MEVNDLHIRHCLLFEFRQGKSAAQAQRSIGETYGDNVIDESTCRRWFRKFKTGDFDLNDKQRCGRPQKVDDAKLKEVQDQDSEQTQQQLGEKLGITQQAVSERLHAIKKKSKRRKKKEIKTNECVNEETDKDG